MFKKIKEFNESNKTIFFFVLCFFLITFFVISFFLNRSKKTECVTPDFKVSSSDIYKSEIRITKPDEVIILSLKRYGGKMLVTKTEKGMEYSYYIYYYNTYQLDTVDSTYKPFINGKIVDGIDNNLLSLDYLEEICANVKSTEEDGSICYDNTELGIKVCANKSDSTLKLTMGDKKIEYTFSSAGEVEDFSVNISE